MTKKDYLSINQLAKACGVSRSTILRMEKDGILKPVYINSENGYRYYDAKNVLRVIRNLTFQEMGLTHKELRAYYDNPDNYRNMLSLLEQKKTIMEYQISNIKLQLMQIEHLDISYFIFPEIYCYTHKMVGNVKKEDVHHKMWSIFNEVLQKGYSIDYHVHAFVLVDYRIMRVNDTQDLNYEYEICIPVLPAADNSGLKKFEKTDMVSTIMYGGTENLSEAVKKLENEISCNGYRALDKARIIAVIGSYPGEDIPLKYRCLCMGIPVIYPEVSNFDTE